MEGEVLEKQHAREKQTGHGTAVEIKYTILFL